VAPAFRAELCAMHQLWMASPLMVDIPLTCYTPDKELRYIAWRLFYEPPRRLAQIPLYTPDVPQDISAGGMVHPAMAVVLATMLEYIAATFGPNRVPVLVEHSSSHEQWATLIPAVFGVSLEEFESGWQHYLAERYDLP
jgi:hypothetical protein